MGNSDSSIMSACMAKKKDEYSIEGTIISPPQISQQKQSYDLEWLNIPIKELKENMNKLKTQSIKSKESFEDRHQRYLKALTISVEEMRKMQDAFIHELHVGLEAHKNHPHEWIPNECSFKMIDACIASLPSGKEKGIFYALDFGGTNFRAVRIELSGDGKLDVKQRQESLLSGIPESEHLPKGLMDGGATALQMFDFFALTVREFMEEFDDLSKNEIQCGFTFSFPCSQRQIDSAVLMCWTKGFETGRRTDDPIENLDVCELMNVAFKRNKVPMICNAVLNDTVGTLLSCAYEMDKSSHPACLVGMILGTGMNCCYYDPTAPQFGYLGKIINIECGNFNRNLPRYNIDCELDFKAVDNRGYQQVEKMCSGAYLGEICRMTLVKIFQNRAPPLSWEIGSLTTENIAKIMNDRSKELIVTQNVVSNIWRIEMCHEDLKVVHSISTAVMDRSAALAAVLISGCAYKTGRLQKAFSGLSVGIDGSLYKRNTWYRERVRYHLDAMLGKQTSSLIHLLLADDGSGKGAGILSATIAHLQ